MTHTLCLIGMINTQSSPMNVYEEQRVSHHKIMCWIAIPCSQPKKSSWKVTKTKQPSSSTYAKLTTPIHACTWLETKVSTIMKKPLLSWSALCLKCYQNGNTSKYWLMTQTSSTSWCTSFGFTSLRPKYQWGNIMARWLISMLQFTSWETILATCWPFMHYLVAIVCHSLTEKARYQLSVWWIRWIFIWRYSQTKQQKNMNGWKQGCVSFSFCTVGRLWNPTATWDAHCSWGRRTLPG